MVIVWVVAIVVIGMSDIAMLMQLNPVSDRPIGFWGVLSGGLFVFSVWSRLFHRVVLHRRS